MKTPNKITKEMTFKEILQLCPESAPLLFEHGLHCMGCHVAAFESLEQGCQVHGLSDEKINSLVKEINILLNKDNAKSEVTSNGNKNKAR